MKISIHSSILFTFLLLNVMHSEAMQPLEEEFPRTFEWSNVKNLSVINLQFQQQSAPNKAAIKNVLADCEKAFLSSQWSTVEFKRLANQKPMLLNRTPKLQTWLIRSMTLDEEISFIRETDESEAELIESLKRYLQEMKELRYFPVPQEYKFIERFIHTLIGDPLKTIPEVVTTSKKVPGALLTNVYHDMQAALHAYTQFGYYKLPTNNLEDIQKATELIERAIGHIKTALDKAPRKIFRTSLISPPITTLEGSEPNHLLNYIYRLLQQKLRSLQEAQKTKSSTQVIEAKKDKAALLQENRESLQAMQKSSFYSHAEHRVFAAWESYVDAPLKVNHDALVMALKNPDLPPYHSKIYTALLSYFTWKHLMYTDKKQWQEQSKAALQALAEARNAALKARLQSLVNVLNNTLQILNLEYGY